jgi:cell division protein FtsQ
MIFGRGKNEPKEAGKSLATPRPRVRPMWRRAWVTPLVFAVTLGTLSGVSWWGWSSGHIAELATKVRDAAISTTASMGFEVRDVMVSGRQQTNRNCLIAALDLQRGAPILAFDIEEAKARIDELPWVRSSTIERMLPDTVLVSIVEREPLVLWQMNGKLRLIDAEGVVILEDGLENYTDLLVVVGDGAQNEAAGLIALLGSQPDLMSHVEAASWVGQRRWNIHLKGGIDVRLPEDEANNAWARLADYHKSHRVLDKDVTVLDLRIPDRLIVKTGPKTDGQET